MTDPAQKPESSPDESIVRKVADANHPGTEFDTREVPVLDDIPMGERETESVIKSVASPASPGSVGPTRVMGHDEFDSGEKRVADKASPGSDLPTGYFRREDFDNLETREVPALKKEWRSKAVQASSELSDGSEVVGEWGPPGKPSRGQDTRGITDSLPATQSTPVAPIYTAARRAQHAWGALRFEQRLTHLDKLRGELVAQRNDYVPALASAVGRPMVEALCGEYLPVLEALRTLEDVVPQLLFDQHGAAAPYTAPGARALVRNVPWGVVLIFTPSDAPFALPLLLTIDAVATGNAVILCPGDRHPRIADNLRKLFPRAGFPDGLIQVVGGDWRDRRGLLEGGPDMVFFEGDNAKADEVARAGVEFGFGARIGRPTKEMLVVLPSANIHTAVAATLWSAFAGGGFARGRVERVVVAHALYDEFRMHFLEELRTLNSHHAQLANIADSLNPQRLQKILSDASEKGARLTWPAGQEPGRWIHWKGGVIENLPDRALASTERIEGPVCCLYRSEDPLAEAARLNRLAPACTVSVLGTPTRTERAAIEQLPVARISIGEPQLHGGSFAGSGADGVNYPRAGAGPRMMLRPQVVAEAPQVSRRVSWFPYTDDKAYALMDAIEAEYHTDRAKRIKASLRLSLNGNKRRLVRGEDS
ncbi:MAG: aldehyde dehydrogenase family protein [Planctomycetes bacterium]|nr:aldehyde dehydrogenase family protein [Planctomycetota bacterium]